MKHIATATIALTDGIASYGLVGEPPHTIPFASLPELRQAICDSPEFVQGDLADFRRAADNVRLAQLGTLLCASAVPNWNPEDTALIGLNGDGCAHNNRLFWDDFTTHGRESGRATLFVPTLPSIPVCEAAITLSIHGPVRYLKTETAAQTTELLADMFASDSLLRQIMTAEITINKAIVNLYQPTI